MIENKFRFKCYLKKDDKIYNVVSMFFMYDEDVIRVYLDKPRKDEEVTNYVVDGENVILIQNEEENEKKHYIH